MEIQFLHGVGPKRAALLKAELGLETVGDLLRFYPFRYIDRGVIHKIGSLEPGMADVQILATVIKTEVQGGGAGKGGKRLYVRVADNTGELDLVFFKGLGWMAEKLTPGSTFLFFGKPSVFNGRLNIVHPEIDSPPPPGEAGNASISGANTWRTTCA